MLTERLRTTLALCLIAVLAMGATSCGTTEDPPLRLGSSLKDLQSHYVPDGVIEFEYLNQDDERNFTGVVIPAYEVLDKRPDDMGLSFPNIQCLVQRGRVVECKRLKAGKVVRLESIYGATLENLMLKDIGKDSFVKLRLPRIDFFNNFPDIDKIVVLTDQEQSSFTGRVRFSNQHEVFSYDFVEGEAIAVEVSTYLPRRWP